MFAHLFTLITNTGLAMWYSHWMRSIFCNHFKMCRHFYRHADRYTCNADFNADQTLILRPHSIHTNILWATFQCGFQFSQILSFERFYFTGLTRTAENVVSNVTACRAYFQISLESNGFNQCILVN